MRKVVHWGEMPKWGNTIIIMSSTLSCCQDKFLPPLFRICVDWTVVILTHANDKKKKINKFLTVYRHSSQCHWSCTLEWCRFVRPCRLIRRCRIAVFFYPKLIQKIAFSIISKATCTFTVYQPTLLFTQTECSFMENAIVKKGFKCGGGTFIKELKKFWSENHIMHIQKVHVQSRPYKPHNQDTSMSNPRQLACPTPQSTNG